MTDKNSLAEQGDENIIFLSEHLTKETTEDFSENWVDDFLGDLDLTPFWETGWDLAEEQPNDDKQEASEAEQDIQKLMDSIKSQVKQLKGSSDEMAYYLRELDLYTKTSKKKK